MGGRRCIVTGISGERAGLIRFVIDPEGIIVPDIEESLPGRGLWVVADRGTLSLALKRRAFARAARAAVRTPEDLCVRVEALLVRRCQSLIGLALRAGQAVFGYEKTREWLIAGRAGVILEASDGALGECRKLRALAAVLPVIRVLSAGELAVPADRHRVVHGVLARGGLASRLQREAFRLTGIRAGDAAADVLQPSIPVPST